MCNHIEFIELYKSSLMSTEAQRSRISSIASISSYSSPIKVVCMEVSLSHLLVSNSRSSLAVSRSA